MSFAAEAARPEPSLAEAVWRALTWRKLAVAEAVAAVLAVVRYLHELDQDPPPHSLEIWLIIALVGAIYILLAALATDEGIRRGYRASRVFPLALLTASVVTTITQWYLRGRFGLLHVTADSDTPMRLTIEVWLNVCAYGGLAMMAYLQRQNAQRLLEGVRNTELARVRVERDLTESRLAATHAQIDPEAVLKQLATIRDGFRDGLPGAEGDLEVLIRMLRKVTSDAGVARASRL